MKNDVSVFPALNEKITNHNRPALVLWIKTILYGVSLMPWLWRPLWGSVWVDGNRVGKGNDGGSGGGKEGKEIASGEGEQRVKHQGNMPAKWGGYVGRSAFYKPYHAGKKQTEKGQSVEDVVDEVIEENDQSVEDIVEHTIAEKEKGQQVQETGDNHQIIASISRQFEEVGPGVFQFKRPIAPTGWRAQPSAVTRQPVRADVSRYRSAIPTAIADYHQVGQTRDGLPVYSFK